MKSQIVGSAKPLRERIIEIALAACGFLSIAVTLGILLTLSVETIGFFKEVSLAQFFGDTKWTPLFSSKHFGIWPLISGTLLILSLIHI